MRTRSLLSGAAAGVFVLLGGVWIALPASSSRWDALGVRSPSGLLEEGALDRGRRAPASLDPRERDDGRSEAPRRDTVTRASAGDEGAGEAAAPGSSATVDPELVRVVASGAEDELASVVRDLETGRFWHASSRLRDLDEPGRSAAPETRLLRARAEAGWGNWPVVRKLLAEVPEGEGGEGEWWLRARAAEEAGAWREAAEAFRRFSAGASGSDPRARMAEARRVRSLDRAGRTEEALERLAGLTSSAPWIGSWLGLERAREASERGDVEYTRRLVAGLEGPAAAKAWNLLPRARLASGDTARALALYEELARDAATSEAAAGARIRLGELHLAQGDSSSAREAFRAALATGPRDAAAARGLVESRGLDDGEVARRAFRTLEAAGEPKAALRALERYVEHEGEEVLEPSLRLDRAALLLRGDRPDEAEADLRELVSSPDLDVERRALELSIPLHRLQGRGGRLRATQERLVERFPSSPVAVDVVFFRADARHDRGDRTGAARGYRKVLEMAPDLDRAGLARMRLGQIHLAKGDLEGAARVFEEYLDAFPRGRRWEEAAYWAARIRTMEGGSPEARRTAARLLREEPFSYYAVLARELVPEEGALGLPEGEPPPRIAWIDEEIGRIEELREAGLEEGAAQLVSGAKRRAAGSQDALLRLSLELSDAGFPLEGIRLGWEVREGGRPWDRTLARAVFPFPHRELVAREAAEWGVDPYLVAGLIRQESAFEAEIRSGAGAVGLMQLLPATARELARRVGPGELGDEHLEHPELNLHLGIAFLTELQERFGDRLPFVLSAYNAGPSRARRWKQSFPEADDPLRFTERIPYAETRGYVKLVTRNRTLYRWLYGGTAEANVDPPEPGR